MRYLKLSIVFLISFNKVQAQSDSLTLTKINLDYEILDTIKLGINSTTVHAKWIQDTIRIRFRQTKEKDYDPIFNIYQNCFSFALEKYFNFNNKYRQDIFTDSTFLETVDILLDDYFKNIMEIEIGPSKYLNVDIPSDVLIAFCNNNDHITHIVYFNQGIIYSKNGGFQPKEFKSLKKFLKKYYLDTKRLIIYQLDEDKVNSTYANTVYKQ